MVMCIFKTSSVGPEQRWGLLVFASQEVISKAAEKKNSSQYLKTELLKLVKQITNCKQRKYITYKYIS